MNAIVAKRLNIPEIPAENKMQTRKFQKSSTEVCVTLRALSIRQPAAGLIARGLKPIENRDWQTTYRGAVMLHASGRFESAWAQQLDRDGLIPPGAANRALFTTGAFVGATELVDCIPYRFGTPSERRRLTGSAQCAGILSKRAGKAAVERFLQWACGRYCWLLRDPIEFSKPIPCLGKLNLWRLNDSQQAAVSAAVAAAIAAISPPPPWSIALAGVTHHA